MLSALALGTLLLAANPAAGAAPGVTPQAVPPVSAVGLSTVAAALGLSPTSLQAIVAELDAAAVPVLLTLQLVDGDGEEAIGRAVSLCSAGSCRETLTDDAGEARFRLAPEHLDLFALFIPSDALAAVRLPALDWLPEGFGSDWESQRVGGLLSPCALILAGGLRTLRAR